jgi:hypothetical protein
MRWQDPFVNADSRIEDRCRLWGKPTDIAQTQGELAAALARSIERPCRGGQHLSCIDQKVATGGRQVDVSAVADEKLSPELTFEVADLLRQRRCRNVKPLRGPTEVQLFGHRHEIAQLSELHTIDRNVRW